MEDAKMEQKVIRKMYQICSDALPNKEGYTLMDQEQLAQKLKEEIEALKSIQGTDQSDRYFYLLSHFGKTGKHFAKYPVIHLVL